MPDLIGHLFLLKNLLKSCKTVWKSEIKVVPLRSAKVCGNT